MTVPPTSLLASAEPPRQAAAGANSKRVYRANAIQWAVFAALLAAPARDNPRLRSFLSRHHAGPMAEPLTPATDIRGFSCGVALLDDALPHEAQKAASPPDDLVRGTFVALNERRVTAYFTQRLCFVRRAAAEAGAEVEADTIPIIQLQRLAVDRSVQGQGIGTALLRQAVLRALLLAERCGAPALWVPVLSLETRPFYLDRGLQPMPAVLDSLGVLLTFDTVRRALADSTIADDSRPRGSA